MEQVRAWISTQQLWNWHALHCLLTVIFLLDFIKTPSVVRADKESKPKYRARHGEREKVRACMCAWESCTLQDSLAFLRGRVGSWRLSFNTKSPTRSDFCLLVSTVSQAKAICGPNEVGWVWVRLELEAGSACLRVEPDYISVTTN